jgi:tRNA 2-thiouridine synthesizing protein A
LSAPITRQLDVTGTFCPLPILLAVREMVQLATGDRLEIVGDDPGILEDMPIWCERAGHRLIEISEREGKIISIIEKGGRVPSPRRRRGKSGGGGGAGPSTGPTTRPSTGPSAGPSAGPSKGRRR